MSKISCLLTLDISLIERLEAIEQRLIKIDELLTKNVAKVQTHLEPIPQKNAMHTLHTTFPTFKKLLLEFNVKPIKRGNRLFYRREDIAKMVKWSEIKISQ